jgi:predicted flap endonuclease-1-like 5' DNA nuclease
MRDDAVAELLEELEQLEDDVAATAGVGNTRDDLMQIKGVGPAIAKTLHELGIFQFEQIAAMSEYDIDRVAERLKGFRSRIYREDWIGQARLLLDQKQSGSA